MQAKYVNPYTDFGFKKIFGEEASKPLLIDFLNSVLPEQHRIIDLNFKNAEQLGLGNFERKAIYDIYCENEQGEKFIVELQRVKQNYFKDRTVYYATFPIREQAERGSDWNFQLKAVYCIGILDFTFDDYESEPERSEVLHTIKLKNQHNKVFYDKLTFIYLEMPNFIKQEHELNSRLDQWLYFIKHLEDFQHIPDIFKDQVFKQAFETAELANLKKEDWAKYEASLKVYRDLKNSIDTAFSDGKIEGKQEGLIEGKRTEKFEIAKQAKLMGLEIEDIVKLTGLTADDIEKL